jgi:hypothetical protein
MMPYFRSLPANAIAISPRNMCLILEEGDFGTTANCRASGNFEHCAKGEMEKRFVIGIFERRKLAAC